MTRDLHYIIDAKYSFNKEGKLSFWYQKTDTLKEQWFWTDTHNIPNKIGTHSLYSFPTYELNHWEENYASTLLRCGPLFVDFDSKETPASAVVEAQNFVRMLIEELKVPALGITTAISGAKGAVVILDSRVLGEKAHLGHPKLPTIHKRILEILGKDYKTIDFSIYNYKKGRLVRTLRTKRSNGAFRANVPVDEFLKLDPDELLLRVNAPGPELVYPENLESSEKLVNLFNQVVSEIENENKNNFENIPIKTNINSPLDVISNPVISSPCIKVFNSCNQKIISQKKTFNDLSYLIASVLKNGSTEKALLEINPFLQNWNSGSYPDFESRKIHFVEQMNLLIKDRPTCPPFCQAIRRSISKMVCSGCTHLEKTISLFSKPFVLQNGLTGYLRCREGEPSEFIPIVNAIAIFKQKKTIWSLNHRIEKITFIFDVLHENESFTIEVNNDTLQNNDELQRVISLESNGKVLFNTREKKNAIVLLQLAMKECAYLDDSPSFSKIGFVNPSKFIYTNCSVINENVSFFDQYQLVEIPVDSKAQFLRWTDKTFEEVSSALKTFLKTIRTIHEDKVALPVIAFSILPIAAGVLDTNTRFYIHIRGSSGDSKTTLAKAALAFWGDFYRLGSLISASSTANRIEVDAAFFRHSLVVIDDVKESNISNPDQFRRVLQNYADGAPRSRLKADSQVMNSKPIEGWILLTGEDTFTAGETSLIGRGLEITVERVTKDINLVASLEEIKDKISGVLPYFTSYIQKIPPSEIKIKLNDSCSKFALEITNGDNLDRVINSLALLETTWFLFTNWLQEKLGWSKEECSELFFQGRISLLEIGLSQASAARELVAAHAFVRVVSELLASRKASIELPGSESKNVIGRLFPDHSIDCHVYLLPTASYNATKDHAEKSGMPFKFSIKALASSLFKHGYLKKCDTNQKTKKRKHNGINADYWVLDKKAIGIDGIDFYNQDPSPFLLINNQNLSNRD